jgi:SAM-dependent methyltransferase
MISNQADTFADSEHHAMAAVEDTMFYYIGLHRLLETQLLSNFNQSTLSVLDAGCGTGGFIKRLKVRYPKWTFTGLDYSAVACDLARQRTAETIVQGSILELPFADQSFDAVVTADVLYHLPDDSVALKEIYRVLKPGGIIVMNLPAHRWLWSYHDVAVAGLRRYTRREVKQKLVAVGFKVNFCTHWNTLLLPLIILKRKVMAAPKEGSDVKTYSPLLEWFCGILLSIERAALSLGIRLPLGSSVLAVARKMTKV